MNRLKPATRVPSGAYGDRQARNLGVSVTGIIIHPNLIPSEIPFIAFDKRTVNAHLVMDAVTLTKLKSAE